MKKLNQKSTAIFLKNIIPVKKIVYLSKPPSLIEYKNKSDFLCFKLAELLMTKLNVYTTRYFQSGSEYIICKSRLSIFLLFFFFEIKTEYGNVYKS